MGSVADAEIACNLRSRKIDDSHSDSNRGKKPRLQKQEEEKEIPTGWFPPEDVGANFWKKLCIPSLLHKQCAVVALAEDVDEESSAQYSWIADEEKRRQGKVVGDEEMWKYWANKALEHYNRNFVPIYQKVDFRLLEVTRVLTDCKKIHINFKATELDNDDDASSKLFFAQLSVRNWGVPNNVIAARCCILQQVDSGDLDDRPCSLCGDSDLVHPTARYGHCSASGDAFAREAFLDGHVYKAPPPPKEPQTLPTDPKTQENENPFRHSAFHPTSKDPLRHCAFQPAFPPTSKENPVTSCVSSIQQRKEELGACIRRMREEWEEAHVTPAMRDASDEYNKKKWKLWANTALDDYNKKLGAKFKFVKIIGVMSNACLSLRLVHISFLAKSDDDDDDGSYKTFFAEMKVPWKEQDKTIVRGCCTLEETDSGEDLNARPCSHCYLFDHPHPSPRYGYRSSSGDLFDDLESRY